MGLGKFKTKSFKSLLNRQFRGRSVVRTRELEREGIPRKSIGSLVSEGILERTGRGLYRLTSAEFSAHISLAEVAAKVPHAIVCLISALDFHGIGTQIPRSVWIAIDRKARRPKVTWTPIEVVRFSGAALRYGVEEHLVDGIPVRVTSPARTVVDCVRYRNKIGLDVALEAVREAIRGRKATVDEILRAAEVLRARNVIRNYLEAFLAS